MMRYFFKGASEVLENIFVMEMKNHVPVFVVINRKKQSLQQQQKSLSSTTFIAIPWRRK